MKYNEKSQNALRTTKLRSMLKTGLMLDGGFGSLLLERTGLGAEFNPEQCNLTHGEKVRQIHLDYLAAGADVILANTFGANPVKSPKIWRESLSAAMHIAKDAVISFTAKAKTEKFVALDVGSTGKIVGEGIPLDDAVECFKAVIEAGAQAGADLIFIETMTDIREMRAALIAAKESDCGLPVLASMSFEKNGRSVFGTPVEAFAVTAAALGADALGINCSLGPTEILPMAETLMQWTDLPVFIKPNAGLPTLVCGNTVYSLTPQAFKAAMQKIAALGVKILGGCCGTTPAHLQAIGSLVKETDANKGTADAIKKQREAHRGALSSAFGTALAPKILGERINPTGKPRFKQALKEADFDHVVAVGRAQQEMGAQVLDVNMGFNEIDEKDCMEKSVLALSRAVPLPLCIDSSDFTVLERALRVYPGRALVNSVNGAKESLDAVLPLVKKYGAAVIGLCLDERGVPESAEERLKVGERIVAAAAAYGLPKHDVYLDTLTMAQSAGRDNAPTTLKTLAKVHAMGVKTVLGVSNVSFGMPNRADINAKFLEMALAAGLDLCIMNPELNSVSGSKQAEAFLLGADGAAENYLAYAAAKEGTPGTQNGGQKNDGVTLLFDAIEKGSVKDAERLCAELLHNSAPTEVIEKHIIPALNRVGETYESGITFLPQLIASSEAAKAACALVTKQLKASGKGESGRRFVLATVQGDVHDIGKNIVATVVENYGYKVIDLGRDVSIERVVEAAKQNYPCVVGLSALMTTTAVNMKKTIAALRNVLPDIAVLVGGAVLTEEYARQIGGIYCRDAAATVRELGRLFS